MPIPSATRRHALRALSALLLPGSLRATAASANDPSEAAADCIIPAKAGGGFDLTCALARDALQAVRPRRPPLGQRYLPGGIGAVAFDRIATGRLGGPGTLVAFSSGSLLNLAQGRFGPHPPTAVRWIATLGTDYGVIAVHRDSPYKRLPDLIAALRQEPSRVAFGAGGTVGSQDWVKAALLVRAAGRDHRAMRFVSFEGGGDALGALQEGTSMCSRAMQPKRCRPLRAARRCACWPCSRRRGWAVRSPACRPRASKAWTSSGRPCAACT